MKSEKFEPRTITFAILLLYILLIIRNAWVSDDAYITFRTIENFLAGYGMGYNPFVRVQSFTHPLWMLILSTLYFIERLFISDAPNGLYYVTVFTSVILSWSTLYILITKIAQKDSLLSLIPISILVLSNAFISYSTSGLENPLTHFLIALFIYFFLTQHEKLLILSLLASLIALNRMDTILLALPALSFSWWYSQDKKRDIFKIILGFSPFILWTIFSTLYFGFPFPNTAYAKLNTGIPLQVLSLQGVDYILNTLSWEPLTIFVILFTGYYLSIEKKAKKLTLYLGVILYILYIIRIGGDFMAGRFFTAPLLVSVAMISSVRLPKKLLYTLSTIIILLGVFSIRSPLWSPNLLRLFPHYPIGDRNQISDQRLFYFGNEENQHFNSFVENGFHEANLGSESAGSNWYYFKQKKVMVVGALGKIGYEKGPNIYMIDNYALADPLLARLPTLSKWWMIGHFYRDLPEGYYETLETKENMIENPDLALYFEKLSILTSGPKKDWSRFIEIWKFNTGQYDYLIENYLETTTN